MPTLTASSRTANIHQSVVKWAETEIGTGLGLILHYRDSDRSLDPDNLPDQWADLSTMKLSAQTVSQRSGGGKRAHRHEYLINLNLFEVRDRSAQTLYSLDALSDAIEELLQVPASIPVRDYQTVGNPIVGALQATRAPDITRLPTQSLQSVGVNQTNVSAVMAYVSESID